MDGRADEAAGAGAGNKAPSGIAASAGGATAGSADGVGSPAAVGVAGESWAADGSSDRGLASLSVRANGGAVTDDSDADGEWGDSPGVTGFGNHLQLSLDTEGEVDMAAFDSTDEDEDEGEDVGDLIGDDADLSGSVLLALQAEDEEQGGFDSLLDGAGLLGADASAALDGVLHMGGDGVLSPHLGSGNALASAVASAAGAALTQDPVGSVPAGGAGTGTGGSGGGDDEGDGGGWGTDDDDDDDSFAEDWDAEIAAEEAAAAVASGTSSGASVDLGASLGAGSPIQIQRAASEPNVVGGVGSRHSKGVRESLRQRWAASTAREVQEEGESLLEFLRRSSSQAGDSHARMSINTRPAHPSSGGASFERDPVQAEMVAVAAGFDAVASPALTDRSIAMLLGCGVRDKALLGQLLRLPQQRAAALGVNTRHIAADMATLGKQLLHCLRGVGPPPSPRHRHRSAPPGRVFGAGSAYHAGVGRGAKPAGAPEAVAVRVVESVMGAATPSSGRARKRRPHPPHPLLRHRSRPRNAAGGGGGAGWGVAGGAGVPAAVMADPALLAYVNAQRQHSRLLAVARSTAAWRQAASAHGQSGGTSRNLLGSATRSGSRRRRGGGGSSAKHLPTNRSEESGSAVATALGASGEGGASSVSSRKSPSPRASTPASNLVTPTGGGSHVRSPRGSLKRAPKMMMVPVLSYTRRMYSAVMHLLHAEQFSAALALAAEFFGCLVAGIVTAAAAHGPSVIKTESAQATFSMGVELLSMLSLLGAPARFPAYAATNAGTQRFPAHRVHQHQSHQHHQHHHATSLGGVGDLEWMPLSYSGHLRGAPLWASSGTDAVLKASALAVVEAAIGGLADLVSTPAQATQLVILHEVTTVHLAMTTAGQPLPPQVATGRNHARARGAHGPLPGLAGVMGHRTAAVAVAAAARLGALVGATESMAEETRGTAAMPPSSLQSAAALVVPFLRASLVSLMQHCLAGVSPATLVTLWPAVAPQVAEHLVTFSCQRHRRTTSRGDGSQRGAGGGAGGGASAPAGARDAEAALPALVAGIAGLGAVEEQGSGRSGMSTPRRALHEWASVRALLHVTPSSELLPSQIPCTVLRHARVWDVLHGRVPRVLDAASGELLPPLQVAWSGVPGHERGAATGGGGVGDTASSGGVAVAGLMGVVDTDAPLVAGEAATPTSARRTRGFDADAVATGAVTPAASAVVHVAADASLVVDSHARSLLLSTASEPTLHIAKAWLTGQPGLVANIFGARAVAALSAMSMRATSPQGGADGGSGGGGGADGNTPSSSGAPPHTSFGELCCDVRARVMLATCFQVLLGTDHECMQAAAAAQQQHDDGSAGTGSAGGGATPASVELQAQRRGAALRTGSATCLEALAWLSWAPILMPGTALGHGLTPTAAAVYAGHAPVLASARAASLYGCGVLAFLSRLLARQVFDGAAGAVLQTAVLESLLGAVKSLGSLCRGQVSDLHRRLAVLCDECGDHDRSLRYYSEALVAAKEARQFNEVVYVTDVVCNMRMDRGELWAARRVVVRTIAFLRRCEDEASAAAWGSGSSLRAQTAELQLQLARVAAIGGSTHEAITVLSRLLYSDTDGERRPGHHGHHGSKGGAHHGHHGSGSTAKHRLRPATYTTALMALAETYLLRRDFVNCQLLIVELQRRLAGKRSGGGTPAAGPGRDSSRPHRGSVGHGLPLEHSAGSLRGVGGRSSGSHRNSITRRATTGAVGLIQAHPGMPSLLHNSGGNGGPRRHSSRPSPGHTPSRSMPASTLSAVGVAASRGLAGRVSHLRGVGEERTRSRSNAEHMTLHATGGVQPGGGDGSDLVASMFEDASEDLQMHRDPVPSLSLRPGRVTPDAVRVLLVRNLYHQRRYCAALRESAAVLVDLEALAWQAAAANNAGVTAANAVAGSLGSAGYWGSRQGVGGLMHDDETDSPIVHARTGSMGSGTGWVTTPAPSPMATVNVHAVGPPSSRELGQASPLALVKTAAAARLPPAETGAGGSRVGSTATEAMAAAAAAGVGVGDGDGDLVCGGDSHATEPGAGDSATGGGSDDTGSVADGDAVSAGGGGGGDGGSSAGSAGGASSGQAEGAGGGRSTTKVPFSLGQQYYLHGKILQAAARLPQAMSFPFRLAHGTAGPHCTAGYYHMDPGHPERSTTCAGGTFMGGGSVRLGAGAMAGAPGTTDDGCECNTHGRGYSTVGDLVWDALNCFRRAYDVFYEHGDEVRIAKAAGRMADVYLAALFVPVALLGGSLDRCMRLEVSGWRAEATAGHGDESHVQSPLSATSARTTGSPSPTAAKAASHGHAGRPGSTRSAAAAVGVMGGSGGDGLEEGREWGVMTISLHDVDRAASLSLRIAVQIAEPFLLLRGYLATAELRMLHGRRDDALAHWREARNLFNELFVDGASVPVARVATAGMLERVGSCVSRIVRFLMCLDSGVINSNLLVLDTALVFQMDAERALSRPRPPVAPGVTPFYRGGASTATSGGGTGGGGGSGAASGGVAEAWGSARGFGSDGSVSGDVGAVPTVVVGADEHKSTAVTFDLRTPRSDDDSGDATGGANGTSGLGDGVLEPLFMFPETALPLGSWGGGRRGSMLSGSTDDGSSRHPSLVTRLHSEVRPGGDHGEASGGDTAGSRASASSGAAAGVGKLASDIGAGGRGLGARHSSRRRRGHRRRGSLEGIFDEPRQPPVRAVSAPSPSGAGDDTAGGATAVSGVAGGKGTPRSMLAEIKGDEPLVVAGDKDPVRVYTSATSAAGVPLAAPGRASVPPGTTAGSGAKSHASQRLSTDHPRALSFSSLSHLQNSNASFGGASQRGAWRGGGSGDSGSQGAGSSGVYTGHGTARSGDAGSEGTATVGGSLGSNTQQYRRYLHQHGMVAPARSASASFCGSRRHLGPSPLQLVWGRLVQVQRQSRRFVSGLHPVRQLRAANHAALLDVSRVMRDSRVASCQPQGDDLSYARLVAASCDRCARARAPTAHGGAGGGAGAGGAGAGAAGPGAGDGGGGGGAPRGYAAGCTCAVAAHLKRLVYVLQVEDVVITYVPFTGARTARRLGFPTPDHPAREACFAPGVGEVVSEQVLGNGDGALAEAIAAVASGSAAPSAANAPRRASSTASLASRLQRELQETVATVTDLPKLVTALHAAVAASDGVAGAGAAASSGHRRCLDPVPERERSLFSRIKSSLGIGSSRRRVLASEHAVPCPPVLLAASCALHSVPWEVALTAAGTRTEVARVVCLLSVLAGVRSAGHMHRGIHGGVRGGGRPSAGSGDPGAGPPARNAPSALQEQEQRRGSGASTSTKDAAAAAAASLVPAAAPSVAPTRAESDAALLAASIWELPVLVACCRVNPRKSRSRDSKAVAGSGPQAQHLGGGGAQQGGTPRAVTSKEFRKALETEENARHLWALARFHTSVTGGADPLDLSVDGLEFRHGQHPPFTVAPGHSDSKALATLQRQFGSTVRFHDSSALAGQPWALLPWLDMPQPPLQSRRTQRARCLFVATVGDLLEMAEPLQTILGFRPDVTVLFVPRAHMKRALEFLTQALREVADIRAQALARHDKAVAAAAAAANDRHVTASSGGGATADARAGGGSRSRGSDPAPGPTGAGAGGAASGAAGAAGAVGVPHTAYWWAHIANPYALVMSMVDDLRQLHGVPVVVFNPPPPPVYMSRPACDSGMFAGGEGDGGSAD